MNTARSLEWKSLPGANVYFPFCAQTDSEQIAKAAYTDVVAWGDDQQYDKSAGIGRFTTTEDLLDLKTGQYANGTVVSTLYAVYFSLRDSAAAVQFKLTFC
ncbi:hypothetical protein [Paraburkholderia sediminicola]|uniref:hypothetical protein n=1 Tax=Paraburkholderia sediminicola TaxID=458836 RepID=UPI0038BA6089